MQNILLSAQGSASAGPTVNVKGSTKGSILITSDNSADLTVQIQVYNLASGTWIPIHTEVIATDDDFGPFHFSGVYEEVRGEVTSWTAGDVSVAIITNEG